VGLPGRRAIRGESAALLTAHALQHASASIRPGRGSPSPGTNRAAGPGAGAYFCLMMSLSDLVRACPHAGRHCIGRPRRGREHARGCPTAQAFVEAAFLSPEGCSSGSRVFGRGPRHAEWSSSRLSVSLLGSRAGGQSALWIGRPTPIIGRRPFRRDGGSSASGSLSSATGATSALQQGVDLSTTSSPQPRLQGWMSLAAGWRVRFAAWCGQALASAWKFRLKVQLGCSVKVPWGDRRLGPPSVFGGGCLGWARDRCSASPHAATRANPRLSIALAGGGPELLQAASVQRFPGPRSAAVPRPLSWRQRPRQPL